MKPKVILFDQDGTLLDSAPGIKHCAQETLKKLGYPVPEKKDLNYFIGPPLRDCFRLSNVKEEDIEQAVLIYRKLYESEGKYNAAVYPSVEEGLKSLKQTGYRLFVCTSKNGNLAKDILAKFKLDHYFEQAFGSSSDGVGARKGEIIRRCLSSIKEEADVLMIGDTHLDAEGANQNNIPCLLVSFGYGDKAKIEAEHPYATIDSFLEIEPIFKKIYEGR